MRSDKSEVGWDSFVPYQGLLTHIQASEAFRASRGCQWYMDDTCWLVVVLWLTEFPDIFI